MVSIQENATWLFHAAAICLFTLIGLSLAWATARMLIKEGHIGRWLARVLVRMGHDYSTGKHSPNPIKVINGGPGGHELPYMARVIWTPNTRWGQGYFHCFLRHDEDRDPHDHPFGFTTIPLNKSYVEEVFDKDTHCFKLVCVRRWRRHYRPAEHCHRVIAVLNDERDPRSMSETAFPLFTIVWRGASGRQWGFWTYRDNPLTRGWVHWKDYVIGRGGDNLPGPADHMCPGGTTVQEKL